MKNAEGIKITIKDDDYYDVVLARPVVILGLFGIQYICWF